MTFSDFPPVNPVFTQAMQALGSGLPASEPSFDLVWRAIVQVESGGREDAVGDNGRSIGLLQLNRVGGQGTGYTAGELFSPTLQAQLGGPPIADAYRAGVAQGLSGAALLDYVAVHSGHPLSDGDTQLPQVQDYLRILNTTAGYPASPAWPVAATPDPAPTEQQLAEASAWAQSFLPATASGTTLVEWSDLLRILRAIRLLHA